MVLYYGVGQWNAWFCASIYLGSWKVAIAGYFERNFAFINSKSYADRCRNSDTEAIGVTIRYATTIVATVPDFVCLSVYSEVLCKGRYDRCSKRLTNKCSFWVIA